MDIAGISKFINNCKVFFNMLNIIDQWIPSFVVVVRDGLKKKHNYSPEDDNTRRKRVKIQLKKQ
jgi:hypothetical protein